MLRLRATARHAQTQKTAVSQLSSLRDGRRTCTTDYSYAKECRDLVRSADRGNYICALMYPPHVKKLVIASRAMNIETALIRIKAKDAARAKMRITWWRDVVNFALAGKPIHNHPVSNALTDALKDVSVSKLWLKRLLDAREKDIDAGQPATMKELEDYADGTQSALLYLTLEAFGIKNVNSDHAASHVGKAAGLCTVIKAIPFNVREGLITIPAEIMAKHKLTSKSLLSGETSKELRDVVYELADTAHAHLEHARKLPKHSKEWPKGTHKALISAAFIDDFLALLQQCNFNPNDARLIRKPTAWPILKAIKNFYFGHF